MPRLVQTSSATSLGLSEVEPTDAREIPHIEESRSAGDLLIECPRGYAPHHRLPNEPHFHGDVRSEADLRFEMTVAAMRVI